MDLPAGEACLDFVNTGSRLIERHAGLEGEALRAAGPFGDRLESYGDLVTFGERAGLIDAGLGRRLRARAAAEPGAAAAVLGAARELRESLYRLFAGVGDEGGARAADLERVRDAAAAAAARQRLVRTERGFELTWPEAAELERLIWPLATSAMALLVSGDMTRVKECASHDCNWLFLDESRNRSRRWCDMKVCGNRAKARHYYHRHQGG
ncbi:MAG TPA: CGNR zinc finger domain-containing protein [Longimicrobiales bacterium]|nr:CGNR zinc finger domain-containing protein [Longimicrobiales bacterium]